MSLAIAKSIIATARTQLEPPVCVLTQGGHVLRGFQPFLTSHEAIFCLRPKINSHQDKAMMIDVASIVAAYVE